MSAITNRSDISIERAIQELPGNISVDNLCNYFNLKPDSIKEILCKYEFNKESWKVPIHSEVKLKSLRQCFKEEFVINSILRNAMESRRNTFGYLRQEGLLDDNNYAIVDSGWMGALHYALSKLLRMANKNIEGGLAGYYFGIASNKYDIYKDDKRISWFYRYGELENRYITDLNYVLVFERFLSADHGRTVNYTIGGKNKYEPVLNRPENTDALEWGIIEFQKSVINFSSMVTKHCTYGEITSGDMLNVAKKLLMLFLLEPSKDEALVVKSFKKVGKKSDSIDYELCAKMKNKHIIKALLFGKIKEFGKATWIEGSIAISGFRCARIYIYFYKIRAGIFTFLSKSKYKIRKFLKKI